MHKENLVRLAKSANDMKPLRRLTYTRRTARGGAIMTPFQRAGNGVRKSELPKMSGLSPYGYVCIRGRVHQRRDSLSYELREKFVHATGKPIDSPAYGTADTPELTQPHSSLASSGTEPLTC